MFHLPGEVLFWIAALVVFLVVEAVSASYPEARGP